MTNLHTLRVKHITHLSENGVHDLATMTSLQTLDLGTCLITPVTIVEKLSSLSNLTRFSLDSIEHNMNFDFCCEWPYLQRLDLRYCAQQCLTLEMVDKFASLRNLNTLILTNWEFDCKIKKDISRLVHLKTLDLESASISISSFKGISRLPMLKNFTIGRALNDASLAILTSCTTLKSLQIERFQETISDVGMREFSKFKSLQKLILHRSCGFHNVYYDHWLYVQQEWLTGLTVLNLSEYELTDSGIKAMAKNLDLEFLSLNHCKMLSSDGLNPLVELRQLRRLTLYQIKKYHLVTLQKMLQLECLLLRDCETLAANDITSVRLAFETTSSIQSVNKDTPHKTYQWMDT